MFTFMLSGNVDGRDGDGGSSCRLSSCRLESGKEGVKRRVLSPPKVSGQSSVESIGSSSSTDVVQKSPGFPISPERNVMSGSLSVPGVEN